MADSAQDVSPQGSWVSYSRYCGLFVVVAGIFFLLGWVLDIEILKRFIPDTATMKFNTALCFTLLGFTLFQQPFYPHNKWSKAIHDILPASVLMIALVTLVEYFFGINTGIDQLIIRDNDPDAFTAPGRMSSGTAISFAVLAVALPFNKNRKKRNILFQQAGILFVLMLSSSVLVGYVYGVHTFSISFISSMALHTSILFVVLAVGMLLHQYNQGIMSELCSEHVGGRIARAGLPVIVLLPIFLGWLSLAGLSEDLYSVEYAFSIKTFSNIIIMAVLLWICARKLNVEESRFTTIVEAAPTSMVIVNDSGEIQLVNKQTEKLFGYKRQELLGRKIEILLPERYRGHHPDLRERFAKNPVPGPIGIGRDLYALHRNSAEIQVEVALNPIRNNDGIAVIAAITDITARKQAEQELERSNRDLEQFAYVASHDLQEPLRAVTGCVQILQRNHADKLDDNARELINHAVDGATRMQRLIQDLLTYSRVKRHQEDFVPTDLNVVLDSALKNLETAIAESGARIESDDLPTLRVIPTQFVELFQNLTGNAIKFRRKDIPPEIRVKYRRDGKRHIISIIDNGIGIEEKYFDRIFVIFQRLHTREDYAGTGIGLAMCKRIIDYHHGEIRVESSPGEGTCISFVMPVGVTPLAEDGAEIHRD